MIVGEPLITLDELSARVHETFTTPQERAQAKTFIASASARVRAAGRNWNRVDVPEIAHAIALESAARDWDNPAGLQTERADTLNQIRGNIATDGGALTAGERMDLRAAAGIVGGVWSVKIDRRDTISDTNISANANVS